MPKRVDHEQRRQHIADALLRVVSNEGLQSVTLRRVATEAGVTAGMVQHYFPSKESMVDFAMHSASVRYERRITDELATLADPEPRDVIRVLVGSLLPADDTEADDARIALAFQTHAAHHADAAAQLGEGNAQLRAHIATLLEASGADVSDRLSAAAALMATAEGLAIQMLSAQLPEDVAVRALDQTIDSFVGSHRP